MIAAVLTDWRLAVAGVLLLGAGYMAWEINDRAYDRGHADALRDIQRQISTSEGMINDEVRRARDAARDAARRVCERQADPSACRFP